MERVRASPWATLADLKVFWLTLALLLAADLVAGALVPHRTRSSTDAIVGQSRTPAPAEVVLLGSSRMRPVRPADVGETAGATVVNLAYNGGSAEGQAAMARRYLTPDVLRAGGTRLVLLGASVVDLNDGYRNPALAALTWSFGDFLRHWLIEGSDVRTRAWIRAHPPASWSGLLRARQRSKLRPLLAGLAKRVQGWLFGGGGPKKKKSPTRSRPDGPRDEMDAVLQNATAQKAAAGATSLADIPPPTNSLYLRDFAIGGRQVAALAELNQYLRGHGVRLAVVHMPVSEWYQAVYRNGELEQYVAALRAVAEREDIPIFVLPRGSHGLAEGDFFRADGTFDGHHIAQPGGRAELGRSLGRIARGLLGGAQPRFTDSRIEPLR